MTLRARDSPAAANLFTSLYRPLFFSDFTYTQATSSVSVFSFQLHQHECCSACRDARILHHCPWPWEHVRESNFLFVCLCTCVWRGGGEGERGDIEEGRGREITPYLKAQVIGSFWVAAPTRSGATLTDFAILDNTDRQQWLKTAIPGSFINSSTQVQFLFVLLLLSVFMYWKCLPARRS